MVEKVLDAFRQVANGYSPDRIVVDPELNLQFIAACRSHSLSEDVADINLTLLNAREASRLGDYRTTRRTTCAEVEEYRHASEVAARLLERREGLTLDRIICDPDLAAEFDELASTIAPGYSPLQYRWAALSLRKTKKLPPERIGKIIIPDAVNLGRVDDVDLDLLPREQGIYIFYSPKETLYVGETSNLRGRVGKHLDHSDNKNLARWLWDNGTQELCLEIMVLPSSTSTPARRAVESELIESRNPQFNIQR